MSKTALIIVDVQNDFLPPTGSLAVPNGRQVLPVIEELLSPEWEWGMVIASQEQDYHPPSHISFASSHPPHPPFSQLELTNAYNEIYTQTLWPDHCVQGTAGAEIEMSLGEALKRRGGVRVVRKGVNPKLEAYSAFEGNLLPEPYPPSVTTKHPETLPAKSSELADLLRQSGIEKTVIVGLATDFCVNQTALSSLRSSFSTLLLAPAIRGISSENTAAALSALEDLGGIVIGQDGDDAKWQSRLHEWIS
ncbi:hypothetical protein IAR50_000116 [Cryptococcus sp. DSM 104548]